MEKNFRFRRMDNPPSAGRVMQIRKVRESETLTCAIVSRSITGCRTHWNGKQTVPCFAEKRKCEGCRLGYPARWIGFLHVCNLDGSGAEFLELTTISANRLLHLQGDRPDLRGMIITVNREGGKKKAPLKVAAHPDCLDPQKLGKALEPWPTLQRLWRLNDIS